MTNYRRRRKPKKPTGKRYNINERIAGEEFRVINEEGGMIGILAREEALNLAEEQEMDLVEINPKADPPVIKLIEFSKFKYQMAKAGADKQKVGKDFKTIRVSVAISENDLLVQAKKIDKFLEKGMKVKIRVWMRGREKAYPEIAKEMIEKFLGMISQEYEFENEPKLAGDSYYATIKGK